VSYIDL